MNQWNWGTELNNYVRGNLSCQISLVQEKELQAFETIVHSLKPCETFLKPLEGMDQFQSTETFPDALKPVEAITTVSVVPKTLKFIKRFQLSETC